MRYNEIYSRKKIKDRGYYIYKEQFRNIKLYRFEEFMENIQNLDKFGKEKLLNHFLDYFEGCIQFMNEHHDLYDGLLEDMYTTEYQINILSIPYITHYLILQIYQYEIRNNTGIEYFIPKYPLTTKTNTTINLYYNKFSTLDGKPMSEIKPEVENKGEGGVIIWYYTISFDSHFVSYSGMYISIPSSFSVHYNDHDELVKDINALRLYYITGYIGGYKEYKNEDDTDGIIFDKQKVTPPFKKLSKYVYDMYRYMLKDYYFEDGYLHDWTPEVYNIKGFERDFPFK